VTTGRHRRKNRKRWLGIPLVIAMGVTTMALLEPSTSSEPGSSPVAAEQLALPEVVQPFREAHVPSQRTPGAFPRMYMVRAGDTLSGIAGRECGAPGDWPALWKANKAAITSPGIIIPGEVLRIAC
jgi:nucleoid-associated protein YgaU